MGGAMPLLDVFVRFHLADLSKSGLAAIVFDTLSSMWTVTHGQQWTTLEHT